MEENINWDLCLICQVNSGIKLRNPVADDPIKSISAFSTFLNNVNTLRNLGCQIPDIIDENFTPFYLNQRNAKWHKDFHSKYDKQKVERAHKRKQLNDSVMEDTRMQPKRKKRDIELCLFCRTGLENGCLNSCSTFNIDQNIKKMAQALGDNDLLSKLEGGTDLIAMESKYHKVCYTNFGNRHRAWERKSSGLKTSRESEIQCQVFEELVSEIMDDVTAGNFSFYLDDLFKMYTARLDVFEVDTVVNKTHFEAKVLSYFGTDLQEQKI